MSSRIMLTKDAEFFAIWRKFQVFVDGQRVGTIPYRKKTGHFFVRPGKHQVQVRIDWYRSNLLDIELAEGEVIYLESGSNSKGWRLTVLVLCPWFGFWPKGWLWLRIAHNKGLASASGNG